jgi:hypothetical protein
MTDQYKKALEDMPDGSDIHNASDWLVKHGKIIKSALLAMSEQPERVTKGELSRGLSKYRNSPDVICQWIEAAYPNGLIISEDK